jgi:hypothetical protein
MNQPSEEPCGCNYGSADNPFEVDPNDPSKPFDEYNHDPGLLRFTECLECGAVWTTRQDNAWVRTAERVPL